MRELCADLVMTSAGITSNRFLLREMGFLADLTKYIEHTLLKPQATQKDFVRLCTEAVDYGFYGICVPPNRVSQSSILVKGSGVRVVTVVGFPLGFSITSSKLRETELALTDGADEIDAVIDISALKEGRLCSAGEEVRCLAEIVHSAGPGHLLKVIIEVCYLTDEEKRQAALMIRRSNGDFVKTSTGFGSGGASVHDVDLLRQATGGKLAIKAAGGIRDRRLAQALITAGAVRLGTSNGPALLQESF
jgi:deoxyribose-phosphate aldolase